MSSFSWTPRSKYDEDSVRLSPPSPLPYSLYRTKSHRTDTMSYSSCLEDSDNNDVVNNLAVTTASELVSSPPLPHVSSTFSDGMLDQKYVTIKLESYSDLLHLLNNEPSQDDKSCPTQSDRKNHMEYQHDINGYCQYKQDSVPIDTCAYAHLAHGQWSTDEDLAHVASTVLHIPSSVRLTVVSSQMLESLMLRSLSHWCCISFKVGPIDRELVRHWHRAPLSIIYCIASISLVTFMDQNTGKSFVKEMAMAFYEKARQKMDDVLFDHLQPLTIQSYFCLSYTSNLLRLYEHQRTWGSLASIALQQRMRERQQGHILDTSTLLCWHRWYYIDAWMSLVMGRDSLLSDDPMPPELSHTPQPFTTLAWFMRSYRRAIRASTLFQRGEESDAGWLPSPVYHSITHQLKTWYAQQSELPTTMSGCLHPTFPPPPVGSTADVHLHLCYHAMRLIILFQFLHPVQPPPDVILIDCLETNLALLKALQYLKDIGCDQSTYHHIFFAIHNSAKRIYQYENSTMARHFAKEQLLINLTLLRSTQAYVNDVFKVRLYVETIEQQFRDMHLNPHGLTTRHGSQHALISDALTPYTLPGIIVFRLETNPFPVTPQDPTGPKRPNDSYRPH